MATVAQAVRIVERAFGRCEPAVNTTRAQPGTVVDPNGLVWAYKCGCPQHPDRGHSARPIPRGEL